MFKMDMKKIVMAATLLSIVTGGEVSALAAKTQHSVAKITHVKVTKHKVTGYTTAQSHVKLMKLKHGEKASATANKHGKFTLKVKSNNLTKLKFELKATKTGLKARTYTHKVKKAVDGATTETQTAPAVVKPDSSSADKKVDKSKPADSYIITHAMNLKGHFDGIKDDAQKQLDSLNRQWAMKIGTSKIYKEVSDLMAARDKAISNLNNETNKDTPDKDRLESLKSEVQASKNTLDTKAKSIDSYNTAYSDLDDLHTQIANAQSKIKEISDLLTKVQTVLERKTFPSSPAPSH
jgi:hypothetical protein